MRSHLFVVCLLISAGARTANAQCYKFSSGTAASLTIDITHLPKPLIVPWAGDGASYQYAQPSERPGLTITLKLGSQTYATSRPFSFQAMTASSPSNGSLLHVELMEHPPYPKLIEAIMNLNGQGNLLPTGFPSTLGPFSRWTSGNLVTIVSSVKQTFTLDSITDCSESAQVVHAYFSIAYVNDSKDEPQSFVRAADTWQRELKARVGFDGGHDKFISAYVRSAQDFTRAWNDILTATSKDGYVVVEGAIFSHATTPSPNPSFSGLEFSALPHTSIVFRVSAWGALVDAELVETPVPSTLVPSMIRSLPRLSWDNFSGKLTLFGCNTAIRRRGNPNWSPASVFAETQHVNTWGENGFSNFSKSPTAYIRISDDPKDPTPVYLSPYCRTYNLPFCTGVIPVGAAIPASLSLP